ncbi:putative periplasmic serine endoprotease DegP-like precursor [Novipirellula aureliae]|uniref:Putative periplasmic serine endoprotease DegP-like n=1 Tax=Novipirellula aureliae TaxID=2527966 RepID=A0A5C6DQ81_9BACT|nr:Do family serine endopeptidase [Novipirellula aureliae]TWU38908.1 putative periplasmic serine endoprotease DegP-like precursor [Novipirellula aureliae]
METKNANTNGSSKQPKPRWYRATLGIAASAALIAGVAISGATFVSADQAVKNPLADLSPQQAAAIESAQSLSSAFRTVSSRVLPAVVAIENRPAVAAMTKQKVQPSSEPFGGQNPFKGTPFEDMFNDGTFNGRRFQMPPNMEPPSGSRPSAGIGSGVIIDPSGIILTNNHVVAGGGEVIVRTQDGREFVATDVWTDPKTDVAVVKIENATDLVAAVMGDSDQVEIGDWVLALGQPFGLESTVTAGIISAKHRGIGIADRENFLQTDAAINPGNSGGPLVNLRGEIVGINTAIHSRSGGNEGIGFAVPSNLANWVSDQLLNSGTVKRAYLGVGIQPVTQDIAKQLSVKPRGGVVVTDVFEGTPAEKAGLKSGDVIVRFNDQAVSSPQALQLIVERGAIGREQTIEVMRDGKSVMLKFVAEEQTSDFASADAKDSQREGKRLENLGLEIAPVDAEVAKQLGVEGNSGVVITMVADGSPADDAGLKPGMLITQVDRQSVESVADFEAAIKQNREQKKGGVLLLVRTEAGSKFVVIKS